MNANSSNRWPIAVAGVVMQVALCAVYAWSVFRIPLTQSYGWTVSQVTLVFELAIFMLGIAAFAGGFWMKRTADGLINAHLERAWLPALHRGCFGIESS